MDLFTFIGTLMSGVTDLFVDSMGPYLYIIATVFVIHTVYRFILAPIFGGKGSDDNRNYRKNR